MGQTKAIKSQSTITGTTAYVVGLAIGDGNLSNPNGRAVRLRITCDTRYRNTLKNIVNAVKTVMPQNKVSLVQKSKNCVDVSCYSNKWENILGWRANKKSKFNQKVSVPIWIKKSKRLSISCLRGLIETDGSVYKDRKYVTVNFVTTIHNLADDVMEMIIRAGFTPNMQIYKPKNGKIKYTIRVSKNVCEFIEKIGIDKS